MSWRRLRTLLRREVLATFRDPFTVVMLLVVPLVALLLFGFVLATDVKNLALGVHDAGGTGAARRLTAEIAAKGVFQAQRYTTREELEHALVAGEVSVAVVIPPDFDRRLQEPPGGELPQIQVLYDGGEATLAGNAEAFLRSLVFASGADIRRDQLRLAPAHDGATMGGVEVVTRAVFNPRLEGKPFMVAGTFGFVLSFLTVLITAVSIVNERLFGTFEQLQITPATGLEILLAKLLPMGVVFTVDVGIMVVVAGFLLGVWPEGNVVFFLALSVFYVFVSLAMGLLISATSHTAAEAVQKTVVLSIPLVQLSGFAFPVRNMPLPVRWISELFPATHYIRMSRAIYIRGEGPLTQLPEIALLVLFGAILIRVALSRIEARA